MMYGRLDENGRLEIYDKPYIMLEGALVANPSDEVMASAGYKPLICERAPDVNPGEILEIRYADTGKAIEAVYTVSGG